MQEQISILWDRCLSQLSKRVKKNSFFTWLKPTEAEYVDSQSFNIVVPNRFAANWIEERYRPLISQVLTEVSEAGWNFGVKVRKTPFQAEIFEADDDDEPAVVISKPKGTAQPTPKLNPRYRFENFVVGDSNQFAYAACQAVAENPGENRYNPALYLRRFRPRQDSFGAGDRQRHL